MRAPLHARAVLCVVLLGASRLSAYQLDTVSDVALAPPAACMTGCANWSDLAASHSTASQAAVNALWRSAAAQSAAGTACAIPAELGVPEGLMCYCAGTAAAPTAVSGLCGDALVPTPTQVNLQFGAGGLADLQVAFATLDRGAALRGPPRVELCRVGGGGGGGGGGACVNVSGHATRAPEPQLPSRVYTWSFVRLPALVPGASYRYRAIGGAEGSAWSPTTFALDVPAADATHVFALFGDQGLYPFSSVGNLIDATAPGAVQPLHYIVHLGDLAYNLAMSNGSRGDGYLSALSPALSRVPWMSAIGNHESEGSPFGRYCPAAQYCEGRYLNQTAGGAVAGAASGSGTQLYYSLDVGLVHWVVLDTMPYLGLGADIAAAQVAWLRRDLAAVDRSATPWVLVATHVPMYCSIDDGACGLPAVAADLESALLAGGVDLYACGHVHAYESMWPIRGGVATRRSLDSPTAPVHVLTGAGGPPGDVELPAAPASYTRTTLAAWSWGRVTVHNASHLTFEQVFNTNGSVADSFTIVQPHHGPFASS